MARSWNTPASVILEANEPELTAFAATTNSQTDENDATKQNIRTQVSASWRWGGVDQATMRWHTMYYRGPVIAIATAANSGIALTTAGSPVTGSSLLLVDNFDNSGQEMIVGSHFMIFSDPTIYTVTASGAVSSGASTLIQDTTGNTCYGLTIDTANEHLYWTSGGDDSIYRCDLDGSNKTTIKSSLSGVLGITIDTVNDKLYWCESTPKQIWESDLDGSNAAALRTCAVEPHDVATDGTTIYYTAYADSSIRSFDIATPGSETSVVSDPTYSDGPRGIALDTTNDKLYWCNFDGTTVGAADTDGSNTELFATTGDKPNGIDIDITNQRLYITRKDAGTVRRISIDDPSVVMDICTSNIGNALALALDASNGHVYVTANTDDDIRRCNIAGIKGVELTVSPVITAGSTALGNNAPVHFFIPQTNGGQKNSGDGELNSIEIEEQFVTVYEDVDQPEEA
jgi:sugar lactone lactonase YvrE